MLFVEEKQTVKATLLGRIHYVLYEMRTIRRVSSVFVEEKLTVPYHTPQYRRIPKWSQMDETDRTFSCHFSGLMYYSAKVVILYVWYLPLYYQKSLHQHSITHSPHILVLPNIRNKKERSRTIPHIQGHLAATRHQKRDYNLCLCVQFVGAQHAQHSTLIFLWSPMLWEKNLILSSKRIKRGKHFAI